MTADRCAMTFDDGCESCGRRGLEMTGIDFRDGSEPFRTCIPCSRLALDSGCLQVALPPHRVPS
jgi:hypothetical protein